MQPLTAASFTFIAKAVVTFWAVVLMAVAAALQAKLNDYYGTDAIHNSNLSGANALIAACVFVILYFVAQFFIQRRKPDSILVSTVVDVSVIGFLWILVLGGVAAESSVADVFDRCDRFTTCDYGSLGKAVLGLGWLFFFMLLGLFCWMLIYTFMHYGSSWSVWRTPFALLVERGAPVASGRDVENKPGVPASTDHQQQAHHTAQPASTTYPPANDPVMGQAPLQMSQTQPTSTQAQT